jgi:hypothetical protein
VIRLLRGAACAIAVVAAACGSAVPDEQRGPPRGCGSAVFFSVANQDERTRDAEIKIVVDGQPVVYGSFRAGEPGENGDYHYIAAQTARREIAVRAVSPGDDGDVVEAKKSVPVKDGIWIVVTRVRDIDGVPKLEIEFSYEGPVASWGEGGAP